MDYLLIGLFIGFGISYATTMLLLVIREMTKIDKRSN